MKNKEKLDKLIRIERTDRDYLSDYLTAKELASKIQTYWHTKGFTDVRIWLEPVDLASGSKRYDIRGNIVFNCASIKSLLK